MSLVEGPSNDATSRSEAASTNAYKGPKVDCIGPYLFSKTLGVGSTGYVKLGIHQETKEKVAIKIIPKNNVCDGQPINLTKKLEREIAIMKLMYHPHVMKLYDTYETEEEFFLILEYIPGGELFEYIVQKGRLDELEACKFFQQIIFGLDYCHKYQICHRDLKPENLLLDDQQNIKLADFGMASLQRKGKLLETSCGSPHYASPEIVRGIKYDGLLSDIWSCGVILYALLSGNLPFDDENIARLLGKVKLGKYHMPNHLSKESKDLIHQMLQVDPHQRIPMQAILNHPWFHLIPLPNSTTVFPSLNQQDDPVPVPFPNMHLLLSTPSSKKVPAIQCIDAEIVQSLMSLGWSDKDLLLKALKNQKMNPEKGFYRLFYERKHQLQCLCGSLPNSNVPSFSSITPPSKCQVCIDRLKLSGGVWGGSTDLSQNEEVKASNPFFLKLKLLPEWLLSKPKPKPSSSSSTTILTPTNPLTSTPSKLKTMHPSPIPMDASSSSSSSTASSSLSSVKPLKFLNFFSLWYKKRKGQTYPLQSKPVPAQVTPSLAMCSSDQFHSSSTMLDPPLPPTTLVNEFNDTPTITTSSSPLSSSPPLPFPSPLASTSPTSSNPSPPLTPTTAVLSPPTSSTLKPWSIFNFFKLKPRRIKVYSPFTALEVWLSIRAVLTKENVMILDQVNGTLKCSYEEGEENPYALENSSSSSSSSSVHSNLSPITTTTTSTQSRVVEQVITVSSTTSHSVTKKNTLTECVSPTESIERKLKKKTPLKFKVEVYPMKDEFVIDFHLQQGDYERLYALVQNIVKYDFCYFKS